MDTRKADISEIDRELEQLWKEAFPGEAESEGAEQADDDAVTVVFSKSRAKQNIRKKQIVLRKIEPAFAAWMKWLERKFGHGNVSPYRRAIEDFIRINRLVRFSGLRSSQIDRYIEVKLQEYDYTREVMKKQVSWILRFFRWACRRHRIANPFADFAWEDCPFAGHSDRVRPRRALKAAEWEWLKATTLAQGIRRRYLSAEDRVLIYRTVIQTGFRAVECSRLRVMDLRFPMGPTGPATLSLPGLPVHGKSRRRTKNAKPAIQYLQPGLAQDLLAMVRRRESGWSEILRKHSNPLFRASRTAWRRIGESVRADLEAAREAYLAHQQANNLAVDPDFLAVANIDGERVDFHALRHTSATWMTEESVDQRTVKSVMRHGSEKMTEHYTHLSAQMKIDAVMRLKGV